MFAERKKGGTPPHDVTCLGFNSTIKYSSNFQYHLKILYVNIYNNNKINFNYRQLSICMRDNIIVHCKKHFFVMWLTYMQQF